MKRRLRKTVKWMLTVLAVLTLVAWVGSRWWNVSSVWIGGATGGVVSIRFGQVLIFIMDLGPTGIGGFVTFSCERVPDPHLYWWFEWVSGGWPYGTKSIPLWLPFLLLAAPAGWLWWRGDRRFPESACQSCGYDLTGNTSGVCPECGKGLCAEGKQ